MGTLFLAGIFGPVSLELLYRDPLTSLPFTLVLLTYTAFLLSQIKVQASLLFNLCEREEKLLETERRLTETLQFRSEFIQSISHEIRTPLNAIVGLAGLMEKEDAPKSRLPALKIAAEDLLTIVNDIFDFARMESGSIAFEQQPFSPRALLQEQVRQMQPRAHSKGMHIQWRVADDVPARLHGDTNRIAQIVSNLLSNAVKFTSHGQIACEGRVTGSDGATSRLRIEVLDSGAGIAREAQSRVFQPFAQADGLMSRKFGGIGLGLSLCKRLVEGMGGQIGYISQADIGSCFWFELPLRTDAAIDESAA